MTKRIHKATKTPGSPERPTLRKRPLTTRTHKATKTRSNRPGWSVTFSHPRRRDARGKFGLKVRRGLGTTDAAKADRLVDQINALLADQSWWSLDRRAEAAQQFDSVVVSVFFDGIEVGKTKSKDLREGIIPLPMPKDRYARVMLVGATGAGKTTLLRHFIGSDHKRDRFPSTSTAKTTTADIEIVTAAGPFKAAITFMAEHEVRCAVDECLEAACESVIREHDDRRVAEALLEHREQRFRLSYPIGAWQQEQSGQEADNQYEMDYEDEDEAAEADTLADDEIVAADEITSNNERLGEYVARIREVATAAGKQTAKKRNAFQKMGNANQRQEWLEDFTDALYENQDFAQLSLDIMDTIAERFDLVASGDFDRSATGWPTLWRYEEKDRDTFLKQVRWFSSNHDQQFGRLLTPMVDGIRVRGPFQPGAAKLQDDDRRLVLLDGEGLGHSAKEATSVSTKVTEKFPEADMILLVDNAESPMQAASLELLRSVGSNGHGHKLAVAFTHFDHVKGDNLRTYSQKRNHVRASIGNAIVSLRESQGAPVTEILGRQLENNDFYLGGLDRPTDKIPPGFIKDMQDLLVRMRKSAEPSEPIDLAPIYNMDRLELALRDATDGFKNPWLGRLGLSYYEGIRKEHWGRIKALCRRIANRWDDEYNGLRPVANLVRQLQTSISLWLDNPAGWTREPANEDERQAAVNAIRRRVSVNIHKLAEKRLTTSHLADWQAAFAFSGRGSSQLRARQMAQIYDAAAPSITSVMEDDTTKVFLDEVVQIVRDAIEDAGGSLGQVRDE